MVAIACALLGFNHYLMVSYNQYYPFLLGFCGPLLLIAGLGQIVLGTFSPGFSAPGEKAPPETSAWRRSCITAIFTSAVLVGVLNMYFLEGDTVRGWNPYEELIPHKEQRQPLDPRNHDPRPG